MLVGWLIFRGRYSWVVAQASETSGDGLNVYITDTRRASFKYLRKSASEVKRRSRTWPSQVSSTRGLENGQGSSLISLEFGSTGVTKILQLFSEAVGTSLMENLEAGLRQSCTESWSQAAKSFSLYSIARSEQAERK